MLQRELLLPPEVCRLLAARGYRSPDAAKRFLRPLYYREMAKAAVRMGRRD